MSKFELAGRVVIHTARPRFNMIFKANPDGGWEGGEINFPDKPPLDAALIASLMREAGDFFAANVRNDWIQETVIARASALKLTSYEIAKRAKRAGGAVSEDHVRAYITREKSMGSHKLQHVLRVLELKITE